MAPRDDIEPRSEGCPVETIARAYLKTTEGDANQALRYAITDAMSDLMAADQRTRGAAG